MIIGLTGPMASGKTTVVEALKKLGYKLVTLSDMVREEARKRGVPEERENLMEIGGSLRKQFGAGILAQRAKEKIEKEGGEKWVVDGIRNPGEILALRKRKDFVLIANTAPEELIIQRILSRKRGDDTPDKLDEKEIRKKLCREMGEGEPPDGQQVAKCIAMADYVFENTMPINEVEVAFRKLYDKIMTNYEL